MYCYHCMNNKGSESVCPYCHKTHDAPVAAHQLRPGTVLNRKYLVGYVIGEGGFGITYIGRDTTLDVRVAIKEFYPAGYTNRNSYNLICYSIHNKIVLDFHINSPFNFLRYL